MPEDFFEKRGLSGAVWDFFEKLPRRELGLLGADLERRELGLLGADLERQETELLLLARRETGLFLLARRETGLLARREFPLTRADAGRTRFLTRPGVFLLMFRDGLMLPCSGCWLATLPLMLINDIFD